MNLSATANGLGGTRTQRHGDTVAKPLRMQHMILGPCEEIMHHLTCLGMLKFPVLLFAHGFHEGLVDQLPHRPPSLPVLHHQDMISLRDQIRNKRLRAVAVEGTFLIQETLDILPVADHKRGVLEPFQGKDTSIFLGPFGHPGPPTPLAFARRLGKAGERKAYRKCPSVLGI